MLNKNVVFIGGGNMAEGIIRGMINTSTSRPDEIYVSDIVAQRRNYLNEKYHVNVVENPEQSIQKADIVVFAIRPQNAQEVIKEYAHLLDDKKIAVSIIASLDVKTILEWLGEDKKVFRVMPNVLIEARSGYSALAASSNVSLEDKMAIEEMFKAIGDVMYCSEADFNAFTCFSDAGAAYVAYFAAAMINAGVESGFSRAESRKMTIANLIGTAKMLDINNMHPMELTDAMTSPSGVTIEALHILDRTGFQGIVMDAVRAAIDKGNNI